MKYDVQETSKFKKDRKLAKKQGKDLGLLQEVVISLADGEFLDERYNDHLLSGKYRGFRECHITPDWLLIYKIEKKQLVLVLTRTGSHSDLFV